MIVKMIQHRKIIERQTKKMQKKKKNASKELGYLKNRDGTMQ